MAQPRVVVVGAGFGGIGLAGRLLADGVDVTVVEKAGGVGGTWRANTYPGAACDIPSHLYSLSFAPKDDWSRVYAPQPEILAHLEEVTDRLGVRPHLRLRTEVLGATWDAAACSWAVELSDGTTLECEVLVPATGQLNRPLVPRIEGLEDFPGPVVHSARWDHEVDLDGARVAVVGTGASAMQFVPPVADRAGSLVLFQRTPPWVLGRWDRRFSALEQAALAHVPGLRAAYRAGIWAWKEATWPVFVEGSLANRALQGVLDLRLAQRVRDRGLRQRLRPDFAPGCKRVLASNQWYATLQRDHVEVVDADLARVEGRTLVAGDGSRHEVDVVLLATGFRATEMLTPMRITGRDGRDLQQHWADGAEAFLGMQVHGFPNLFVLYGPNTNLAHNSIIHMLESQMAYVRDAVARIGAGQADAFDVRGDVQDAFNRTLDEDLERLVWDTGCTSWYLTGDGRNTNNWPRTTLAYRRRTRRLHPAEHEVLRRTAEPGRTARIGA